MSTQVKEYLAGFPGIYEVPQAARYLNVTLKRDMPGLAPIRQLRSANLIYWIRAGLSLHNLKTVPGRELIITFEDVISMRVIALLRALGMKWRKIHAAEQWLRQQTGYPRPFAVERIWTATGEVFSEMPYGLIAASLGGQLPFISLLKEYLKPVTPGMTFSTHNHASVASTWTVYPDVLLHPRVQFGEPCITGTRIPTHTIWSMWWGGNSIGYLKRSFDLTDSQIDHALEWEDRLRTTHNPSLSN